MAEELQSQFWGVAQTVGCVATHQGQTIDSASWCVATHQGQTIDSASWCVATHPTIIPQQTKKGGDHIGHRPFVEFQTESRPS